MVEAELALAEHRLPERTWSERTPVATPRSALTQRAKAWVTRRVCTDADTVHWPASLGLGWSTVMHAVVEVGGRQGERR